MTEDGVLARGAPELSVGESELLLRNRAGACRLDLESGEIEFRAQVGRTHAEPFAATAGREITSRFATGKISWRREPAPPGEVCAVIARYDLSWRVTAGHDHFVLQTGIGNTGAPVTRLGVRFRGPELRQPHGLRVAYCGAHSQSDLSRSEVVPLTPDARVRSWWAAAVFDGVSEAGVVLGFLAAQRFAGRIDLLRRAFEASHATEQRQPSAGSILWSEPLFFAPTDHATDALIEYGRQVGLVHGDRGGGAPHWGWGSWGHFEDTVTARLALANGAELRLPDLRGAGQPLVHVDHGWEEQFRAHRPSPVWRARRQFGSELAALGRTLRTRDTRLGAWVVPFALNSLGALPPSLHGAVLQDAAGRPQPVIGRECFGLDPTSPAGERWLRALFARLKRAGVMHYKLDFLRVLLATDPDDPSDGLEHSRPFHTGCTRAEAYRHGLGVIRDEVGPHAHLLACGAPLLPSAGLIDSCRIGSDITPEWETGRTGIRSCAENVRSNFFWHGRVWTNDPDFLVLPRDARLFRHWATAVAFSGGTALISTDLPTLSSARRRLLSRFFPALAGAPRPLGLCARQDGVRIAQPVSPHGEKSHLVAFFNRGTTARTFELRAGELGIPTLKACLAWNVLGSRWCQATRGRWRIRVASRDAQVLVVRPLLDHPQLIGSSGHIATEQVELAGVQWNAGTRTLRVTRRRERAWPTRLFFRVPPGFRLKPRPDAAFARNSGLLRLDLRDIASRTLTLSFSPHS